MFIVQGLLWVFYGYINSNTFQHGYIVVAEDPCDECHEKAECKDGEKPGEKICVCKEGYKGDGKLCTGKTIYYLRFI